MLINIIDSKLFEHFNTEITETNAVQVLSPIKKWRICFYERTTSLFPPTLLSTQRKTRRLSVLGIKFYFIIKAFSEYLHCREIQLCPLGVPTCSREYSLNIL